MNIITVTLIIAVIVLFFCFFINIKYKWSVGMFKATALLILLFSILACISIIQAECKTFNGNITDKWTELSLGSTVYRFEIDNEKVIAVSEFEYYNFEIGDEFEYNEWVFYGNE